MMKDRNIGIDILKFLAVLLITNNHMELLYGKYSVMATGGTIGDVLFFFCSGFTLFMKPNMGGADFFNWYKRRINRIYPTVLAVAIISCTIWGVHHDINTILVYGGGWFVTCIMIYYVFIYFIGKYMRDKVLIILVMVSLASVVWFFSLERVFPFNMYGTDGGYLKWLLYFNFMLLGAKLGEKKSRELQGGSIRKLLFAFIGIVLFYAFYIVPRKVESLEYIEILNFIPLLFAVYYLYQWGNSTQAAKFYENNTCYFLIRFIGGLCLEIYLIQDYIFTDRWNSIFPANLLVIFIIIVAAAFLTRCLARFISQTFKDTPYQFKEIIKYY